MRAKVSGALLQNLPTQAPEEARVGDVFYAPSPVGPALWVLMASRSVAWWSCVPFEVVEDQDVLILPAGLIGFLAMVALHEPARALPIHTAALAEVTKTREVSDGA